MRKTAVLLFLTLALIVNAQTPAIPPSKKAVMDAFLAGRLTKEYVPAAFFVHFDSNHKTGEAAVNAHLQFLQQTDADVLKVQFEQGQRRINGLDKQATWDSIQPIAEDYYRPTLEIVRQLHERVGHDIYVMPTVYSAYQVARQSLRDENIARAAVERRADLKRVMGYYQKALLWFVRECKKAGIEAFYMPTQGGEMKYNAIDGFFDDIIKPFDLELMQLCRQDARLTILHICDWEGTYDDLSKYREYPGDIVNTPMHLNGTPFTLTDAEKLFGRPVMGGLKKEGIIVKGTAEEVASTTASTLRQAPRGRVMLGADCTVSAAPIANICAAVSTAHQSANSKNIKL